ncbi:MAG: 6,7-dimethyl-8-ribityllumazine synthase [uncultured Acidimicrobiales bacterium]|uniref:6,7-dimethyl-8-ribityllumazine synthase n=1 Tax=uncultured Acidimicrobiales bacterium TaxID=310071 RepID=A0A6J4HYZ8_9ACTN|nr:MAG: 6,7-dimethyl-8-ribityllumazine synthase [uncultured Acidimicrobiales bacterium]
MAVDAEAPNRVAPVLDGSGMRIAVLCARFNDLITNRLLDGARRGLGEAGVADADVTVAWVPGAFELPFAAKAHAESGRFDAVIVLGAVIRGETTHYDIVGGECARGVQDVQLATGVPVLFGVLTTEDLPQALARSEEPGGHNVGEECGLGAVEVIGLIRPLREKMA